RTGRRRVVSGGCERVGHSRSGRQRLGVDVDDLRPVPRVYADGVLSRILRGFFRWPALRHQGRLDRDCAGARAPQLPQLVPAELSVCVRRVQNGEVIMNWVPRAPRVPGVTTTTVLAEFASDVRRDLQLTPKQLQSKYLYDPLGSSLFEAICRLPWYRITRAESHLLIAHADEIVAALDA